MSKMITIKCMGCGASKEIPEKPEPKNAREAKQIRFNCTVCGAVNYRDGSARANKNNIVKINKANPGPAPVQQPKEVKNATTASPVNEIKTGKTGNGSGLIPWLG